MKSPDKNNPYKQLKKLTILYDSLNKIIENNIIDSFGLILFSLDLNKLNFNYSERIKLFKNIWAYLNKFLKTEDDIYQFEKDKILIFTKNNNLKKYSNKLNNKLVEKTFKINNETFYLNINKSYAH